MTKRAEQAMWRQLMAQVDPRQGRAALKGRPGRYTQLIHENGHAVVVEGNEMRAGIVVVRCGVCGAEVRAGGRKADPALCARCYQRDRRGRPPATEPRVPRDQKLTVQFTKHGREQLERQAQRAGVSVSVFLESLVWGR